MVSQGRARIPSRVRPQTSGTVRRFLLLLPTGSVAAGWQCECSGGATCGDHFRPILMARWPAFARRASVSLVLFLHDNRMKTGSWPLVCFAGMCSSSASRVARGSTNSYPSQTHTKHKFPCKKFNQNTHLKKCMRATAMPCAVCNVCMYVWNTSGRRILAHLVHFAHFYFWASGGAYSRCMLYKRIYTRRGPVPCTCSMLSMHRKCLREWLEITRMPGSSKRSGATHSSRQ